MSQPDEALKTEVENAIEDNFEWKELEKGLNALYRLKSDDGNYILKVQTQENDENLPYFKQLRSSRFRAEPLIYRLVNKETDIPSPEISYVDTTEQTYQKAFYVMEEIEGESAAEVKQELTSAELGEIIYRYGKILGKIHQATDIGIYGLLYSKDGDFAVWEDSKDWRGTFEEILRETDTVIEKTWEEKPELNLEDALSKIDRIPEQPQASLLHMDNRLENLVLEGDKVVGFLDWNFARAGHDEIDLARAEYLLIDYELDLHGLDRAERDQMRERLLEGYREANNIEMNEEFERRRELYRYSTVLWLLAGFPNWSSSWDKEARKEMEEELLARLETEKLSS